MNNLKLRAEKNLATSGPGVSVMKLFPLLLILRKNKLECLSVTSLFSTVGPGPIRVEHFSTPPLYGRLLALLGNIRSGWKRFARNKHASLVLSCVIDEEKSFIRLTPGACIIKLITAVIYGFP